MAAIDDPTTRSALRRYRRRALQAIGGGLLCVAVGVENVARLNRGFPGDEWPISAKVLLGIGGFAVVCGFGGVVQSFRFGQILRHCDWIMRRCTYRIIPMGTTNQPVLVVHGNDTEDEAVCTIPAVIWRYKRLDQGEHSFRIAGDQRRFAVIDTWDGADLLPLRWPRNELLRRKLRKHALRQRRA